MTVTAREERLFGKTEAALDAMRADLDSAFQRVVTEQVGHSRWTGDVDPPATIALDDALRAVLRQLIANGMPEVDTLTATHFAAAAGCIAGNDLPAIASRLVIATLNQIEAAETMTRQTIAMNDPTIAYPIAQLATTVYDADEDAEHDFAALIDASGRVLASYEVQ